MTTVGFDRVSSARKGGHQAGLNATAQPWVPQISEEICGGNGKHDTTRFLEMGGCGAGKATTPPHVRAVSTMQMGHRCVKCGDTKVKNDFSNTQWRNIRSGMPSKCMACTETGNARASQVPYSHHHKTGGLQTISYRKGDPLDGKVGNDIGTRAEAMVLMATEGCRVFSSHCVVDVIGNQWQEFDAIVCPVEVPAPPEDYPGFIRWLQEYPGIILVEVKQGGKVREHKMMFETGAKITPQAKRMRCLCAHARVVFVMMHATPLREGTGKKKGSATIRWIGHDQMMRRYMPKQIHSSLSSIEVLTLRSFTRSLR